MDNTIIQQGTFLARGAAFPAGEPVFIPLRSNVDWMRVINYTQSLGNTINVGVEWFWQRGMPLYDSLTYYHVAADHTLSSGSSLALGARSFFLLDETTQQYGPWVATAGVGAFGGLGSIILTAGTLGLYVGSWVQLGNTAGALQLGGQIFQVTAVNAGVSFTVRTADNTLIAAAAGTYRIVYYPEIFWPQDRMILDITDAAQASVRTAVMHGFQIGQQVRFHIPRVTALAYGTLQLDGLTANVVAVTDAWNFVVDVDTTAMGLFAFPLSADAPFTYAQVTPVGEDTRTALAAIPPANILGDATRNEAQIGMVLYPGPYGPAGQVIGGGQGVPDVMYWVAGKSFNI